MLENAFESQKDNLSKYSGGQYAPRPPKVSMLCRLYVHISICIQSYVDSLVLLPYPRPYQ